MLYENQLENLGQGGSDSRDSHLCGGRAGVYRHRGGGSGGCELAGGAVSRWVRVCDGGSFGADWIAGSGRKVKKIDEAPRLESIEVLVSGLFLFAYI